MLRNDAPGVANAAVARTMFAGNDPAPNDVEAVEVGISDCESIRSGLNKFPEGRDRPMKRRMDLK